MNAEVISIGDELTSGQRLDTNSRWLSERLGESGIRVLYHATVGDELDAMIDVFRVAIRRADLVISTGGLGPTADDLTRDALATVARVELVEDAKSLRHIRALFRLRKREMPERNRIQAMFPAGSRPVANPHGTAPGIDMTFQRADQRVCRWIALPGVPAEMFQMWTDTVEPAIRLMIPVPQVILHRRIKCFGAGESRIEELLPDLIRRGREPTVGITASRATITLRVTTSGPDAAACEEAIQPTLRTIRDVLGNLVFGEEEEELEHAVARLLHQKRSTLAVVEVGTGGVISQSLARLNEGVLAAAWVGDRLGRLTQVLGISFPDEALSLSEAQISQLAGKSRDLAGADIGLAVIAPTGDQRDSKHQVHVALADRLQSVTRQFPFAAHPDIQQVLAAKRGLNELRLFLMASDLGPAADAVPT